MTPDEVESCLRDFNATHKTPPMILIAGDDIHSRLMAHAVGDRVTGKAFFAGVQLLHDAEIKGIVVSS